MQLYSENKEYKLYQGNMLDMLEVIDPETIDSIVCDPPYGLTSMVKRFGKDNSAPVKDTKGGAFARLDKGFMGKEWDGSGIEYNIETWQKCYEVLKPGGYLLAFGGTRTFHRIACAIEDAGFEIRDTIMWLYGSGFPKSLNIGLALDKKNGIESKVVGEGSCGKNAMLGGLRDEITTNGSYEIKQATNEWAGWGTALKPSFEPIIVARKPFKGSLVDNVIEYGVGGINIEDCRVGTEERTYKGCSGTSTTMIGGAFEKGTNKDIEFTATGRFPANTILTYDETDFDEVCGGFPNTNSGKRHNTTKRIEEGTSYYKDKEFVFNRNEYNDSGSASRYFYCAKASKKDRDEGLENFDDGNETLRKNIHPTVKPTELMQYLIRLVTPEGGVVLDPFNGSGSTGKAAMYENKERHKNYKYIGIELTEEYLPIAKARIEYVCYKVEEQDLQMSLF